MCVYICVYRNKQQEKDPETDIDLIELRSLKPLDMDTIRASLSRTHKLAILDESTSSGGVGATISALVNVGECVCVCVFYVWCWCHHLGPRERE